MEKNKKIIENEAVKGFVEDKIESVFDGGKTAVDNKEKAGEKIVVVEKIESGRVIFIIYNIQ